jgi:hypothetical protein
MRVQPVRGGADECPRCRERRQRRSRSRRATCDRAVDRQGREPDQPVRRDEALCREDLRPGKHLCSLFPRALRLRALRQRGRESGKHHPALPRAAPGRSPDDHGHPYDALLHHADLGGRFRADERRADGGRGDLHPEDPERPHRRPGNSDRAGRTAGDHRHPPGREAPRAAPDERRGPALDRASRPLHRPAGVPRLVGDRSPGGRPPPGWVRVQQRDQSRVEELPGFLGQAGLVLAN